jgi:hypothetical protein
MKRRDELVANHRGVSDMTRKDEPVANHRGVNLRKLFLTGKIFREFFNAHTSQRLD